MSADADLRLGGTGDQQTCDKPDEKDTHDSCPSVNLIEAHCLTAFPTRIECSPSRALTWAGVTIRLHLDRTNATDPASAFRHALIGFVAQRRARKVMPLARPH